MGDMVAAMNFNGQRRDKYPRTSAEAFKGADYGRAIEAYDDEPPGWVLKLILAGVASVIVCSAMHAAGWF